MTTDPSSSRSTRSTISTVLIVSGVLLLLIMPLMLFFFAITSNKDAELPGTLVILSSAGGMALIVIGAALRD